jgi:YHS domain-containing protein
MLKRLKAAPYAAAFCIIVLLFASCEQTPVPPVNVTSDGVAIKGYDPVAYFTDQRPVKGTEAFAYSWSGARWLFASAEHRDRFKADPERYAPRYGGYCAFAVSQGKTANIDPAAWTIYEGRLYLNLNKKFQHIWEKDIPGYIRKADEQWPKITKKNRP